ncbi:MAG: GspH/FimT family pseudopilin [Steroidobacteraceae bacterium]|jgi:type IV fimbrial biogenesis protein FimT
MKTELGMSFDSGFTQFELVIVMLIVGIIAAIGVPSFKYVTASNRIAAEINAMLGDMRYARTEAVKEGLPVTVCASADGLTCSKSSASWQSGWIIFSDPSGNQTVGANPILRKQPAFSTSFNNSTDVFVVNNGIYAATFNRQGFGASIPTVTTTTVMALRTQPENTAWTRCLAITVVGQLTIEQTTTTGCT